METALEYSPSNSIFGGVSQKEFAAAISGENQTTSSNSKTVIATTEKNATAPNADNNQQPGAPTTPINARGLGATSKTALAKSNQNVAHVCNIPAGVMNQIFKAGAMGGKVVMAIRKAIRAVLKFFGFSPSSSSLVSYLKKFADWIKDSLKWLKQINKFISGFVKAVSAIKSMISFIMSLPAKLIAFFKDCLQQAYNMLKAGYLSAVALETGTPLDTNTQSIIDSVKEVQNSYNEMVSEAQKTMESAKEAAATATSLEESSASSSNMTDEEKSAMLNDVSRTYYMQNGYSENSELNYSRP